jgi:hypothetical protein
MPSYKKDPDAVLDYKVDWTAWLPAGDTITAATFTADSVDLTIDSSSHTSATATVWLSGGVLDAKYSITNHITTTEGREDDRTFSVTIKQL